MDRLKLLRAIYRSIDWDDLYRLAPAATREEVNGLFVRLRDSIGEDHGRETETSQCEGAVELPGDQEIVLRCDGASRGNPGPAGIGVVIETSAGEELLAWGAAIGRATNNAAEYRALTEGLKKALEMGARRIRALSDSELVVRQIGGTYKVRNPLLSQLHAEAVALLGRFESWRVDHATRAENQRADRLASEYAKKALAKGAGK